MRVRLTRTFALPLTAGLVAATVTLAAGGTAVGADGPGRGAAWVVSLGDSYISGEGGRWAGNTNLSPTFTDAGGQGAYWDAGTGEAIAGCHRSTAAEIHIGVVASLNLACSGAKTATSAPGDGDFKPGIDFFDDGAGHKGQALMLQEFAASHNVRMVQVSIGGNNF